MSEKLVDEQADADDEKTGSDDGGRIVRQEAEMAQSDRGEPEADEVVQNEPVHRDPVQDAVYEIQ